MGRTAAKELQSRGVRIAAFGDGNPALWGSEIDGLPVLSPEQIGKHNNPYRFLSPVRSMIR
jgi:hypothetical protein